MATTLLIDADGIAFKAASAAQRGIRWDDDVFTTHADFSTAKDIFTDTLERIRSTVDEDAALVLAFSCSTRRYFRHTIYPEYKSKRSSTAGGPPPPLCYRDLREWASGEYKSYVKPGLEADDVVGILATSKRLILGDRIVVSMDKDLLQIPGHHLNPAKLGEGVYKVSPGHAERQLWMQVLTGDNTDGYPGLPGCGPVKAEKILEGVHEGHAEVCLKAYLKAGKTAEDFAVQVNVARILHASHYNFQTKEPILWQM